MKDSDSCNSESNNSNNNNSSNGNGNGSIGKNGGSASQSQSREKKDKGKNNGEGSSAAGPAAAAATSGTGATAPQPSPLLKGTLSYNVELRRHVLRGMWNYENSDAFHPQRFELIRNLGQDEDPTELPKDGEFHGSFSLTYRHTTSKGKQRERSKVITESGVKITFKSTGESKKYKVDGEGTNQFGVFQIYGTATKSTHEGDPTYNVELRKRYTGQPPKNAEFQKNGKSKKRKLTVHESEPTEEYPLPPPSESYASNVVCLRGKLQRQSNEQNGVFHQISGMWSSGLDLIEDDPENTKGLCNKFEYVHKCTVPSETFPLSGRYAGWFNLTTDSGKRTKVNEKDVTLKFKKNNAGYYNVEGRGSNAFGKYNISGVLTDKNVITIFRHFQVRKQKKTPAIPVSSHMADPTSSSTNTTQTSSSQQQSTTTENKEHVPITLDDIETPPDYDSTSLVEPFKPPKHGEYSAVHRGVLRINDDGAHTCSGKWAITREHFNNNFTSNFHFGLEAHHATLGAEAMKKKNGTLDTEKIVENSNENNSVSPVPPTTLGNTTFPVDSPHYKGSFKMKRGTTKFQSIIDKQIALKFRKNTTGSYNVDGKGVNSIGVFSLVGTVIILGKGSGQVELYRIYPIVTADPTPPKQTSSAAPPLSGKTLSRAPLPTRELAAAVAAAEKSISDPSQQGNSLSSITPTRKESSRQRKLPSRLEDDNPQAQIARMMDKCAQILKFMKEKDIVTGGFFGEPVDPVAQCIPTYHQIIKNPMDLGTVQTKLDAGDIDTPEEFARYVRLIFENAMKFNIDTTHVVHHAARNLLVLFNQKFRDVERMVEIFRKERKPTKAELKEAQRKQKEADRDRKRKEKEDRSKRKREMSTSSEGDEKRTKLNEMQLAASANVKTLETLSDNVTGDDTISQNDFKMVVDTLKQMQQQMMQMQSMFLSVMNKADKSDRGKTDINSVSSSKNSESQNSTKKKKPKKKAASNKDSENKSRSIAPVVEKEPAPVVSDEEKPLTLKEQEDLTEAINNINSDKLETIIQIIRESANLNDDEEEIDLEIDQLNTSTQRKLQRFVMKNVKQKRPKKPAKPKQATIAKEKTTSKKQEDQAGIEITPEKRQESQSNPKAKPTSFLAFPDSDSGSDSDSEESSDKHEPQKSTEKKDDAFDTNTMHEDDDDTLMDENIAPNWNISKPLKTEEKDSGDEDDAWNHARNTSAAQKALDKERQAREEKMHLEAEAAKEKNLAEAAKRADQLRAKRKEKEAEAARLREQKEQEEEEKRKKAREKQIAEIDSVQQTIDIEHQRDLMKELERDYYDKDLAGASPSSDFGF